MKSEGKNSKKSMDRKPNKPKNSLIVSSVIQLTSIVLNRLNNSYLKSFTIQNEKTRQKILLSHYSLTILLKTLTRIESFQQSLTSGELRKQLEPILTAVQITITECVPLIESSE